MTKASDYDGVELFTFGERLKYSIRRHELTQKALAEAIGITSGQISWYVNGRNKPSYDILIKLAKELDVSLDWLCCLE